MPYGIARFRVQDYAHWKRIRDENAAKFREAGFKSQQVFRNPDDPNTVLILSEIEDLEKARRQWSGTEEFRAYQQRAGITEFTTYQLEEQLPL